MFSIKNTVIQPLHPSADAVHPELTFARIAATKLLTRQNKKK
jgi:hypothetical protein